jgi:CTP synthase (UTP-ammonia lyase)
MFKPQSVINKERRGNYLGKTVQVRIGNRIVVIHFFCSYGKGATIYEDFTKWVDSLYQVVPHITDEIQEWIERVAMNPVDGTQEPADVCVIELGGTIGKKQHTETMWQLQLT